MFVTHDRRTVNRDGALQMFNGILFHTNGAGDMYAIAPILLTRWTMQTLQYKINKSIHIILYI